MTTYLTLNLSSSLASAKNALTAPNSSKLSFCLTAVELKQSSEFTETLAPFESKTVVSTRRSSGLDATTELQVSQPISSLTTTWRLTWTGTGANPLFRTARALSTTALTAITISRLSDTIVRLTQATAPLSTTAIQIGDYLLIEKTTDSFTSPFTTSNQGTPVKVVGKTSTTIDVQDNGFMVAETAVVLGADFAEALKVFSASGVQQNDTLVIKSTALNAGNRGEFKVTAVSSDYVEIEASSLVAETVTGALATNVYFADEVVRFLGITASGQIKVTIDGEPVETSVLDTGAFLAGTFKCTEVLVENLTDLGVSISGAYASTGFEDC